MRRAVWGRRVSRLPKVVRAGEGGMERERRGMGGRGRVRTFAQVGLVPVVRLLAGFPARIGEGGVRGVEVTVRGLSLLRFVPHEDERRLRRGRGCRGGRCGHGGGGSDCHGGNSCRRDGGGVRGCAGPQLRAQRRRRGGADAGGRGEAQSGHGSWMAVIINDCEADALRCRERSLYVGCLLAGNDEGDRRRGMMSGTAAGCGGRDGINLEGES